MECTHVIGALIALAVCPLGDVSASASSETVIYNFPVNADAYGRLLEDKAGRFYGTTYSENGSGIVYQLTEKRGQWRARTIHQFGSSDGKNPYAGLIQDPNTGVFFGTTSYGGTNGLGTVYSVKHTNTGWVQSVLHSFNGSDGENPVAALYRDRATGILYGTTSAGGASGCGTAFAYNPNGGSWTTLYNFANGSDGCYPTTQLRAGSKTGTLLGTTQVGGSHNSGTVYLLSEKSGVWRESVIYTFTGGADGRFPSDMDVSNDGTMYGFALAGGGRNAGVAFQMTKPQRKWVYTVVYTFTGGTDGGGPIGMHLDNTTGIIYGAAQTGGSIHDGVVFKLAQSGSTWTESVLHSFTGGSDGASPSSRPALDPTTNLLYGTTLYGGAHNGGVLYTISP